MKKRRVRSARPRFVWAMKDVVGPNHLVVNKFHRETAPRGPARVVF